MIRTKAWSFYRTSSGVRLCWELEDPKGPQGPLALKSLLLRMPRRGKEGLGTQPRVRIAGVTLHTIPVVHGERSGVCREGDGEEGGV